MGEMLLGLLDGLKGAFKDPIKIPAKPGKAQTMDASYSLYASMIRTGLNMVAGTA